MAETHTNGWWRRALLFGVWTLLGLFTASHTYLTLYTARRAGADLPKEIPNASWPEILELELTEWYIWGILAIAIFALGSRFPLERGRWRTVIIVHAIASVVLAFLETVLSLIPAQMFRQAIHKPTIHPSVVLVFFTAKIQLNILIYWVILGAHQALRYYHRYQERELTATRLGARLAEARLQVLQMQLHPHFLFNTLNAISALIHRDVEVADRMIARLGDLLRATLDHAGVQEVPLWQELDLVRPYLEIEKARLGERLRVVEAIDSAALDLYVPNLLLQPLVENAIRHGIAPRADGGRIVLRAERKSDALQIEIQDDGVGLNHGVQPLKEGVGLSNTRARLQELYGSAHRLELLNGEGHGLCVRVTLPCREDIPSCPSEP